MATLPYTKTEIIDNSAYVASLEADTGINIATIINADTGPMERVSLSSTGDLINYFCTGTKVTAKSDQTIQCIGAMLASASAIDVIRVGTANIKVGKTNKGNIAYFDSNYNLIDKLTQVEFVSQTTNPTSICINIGDTTYYVGTKPEAALEKTVPIAGDVTVANLIRGISPYIVATGDNFIVTTENNVSCEESTCEIASTETSFVPTNQVLTVKQSRTEEFDTIEVDTALTIDDVTYYFVGTGANYSQELFNKYSNPIAIYDFSNEISPERFLAKIVSAEAANSGSSVIKSSIKYNFANVSGLSDTLTPYYDSTTNLFEYRSDVSLASGYFVKSWTDELGTTITRRFIWNDTTEFDDGVTPIAITTTKTDFVQILAELSTAFYTDQPTRATIVEPYTSTSIPSPSVYFNNSTISIATVSNYFNLNSVDESGLYQTKISIIEPTDDEFSVMVGKIVYYIGDDPTEKYSGASSSKKILDSTEVTFSEFITALISSLSEDYTMGKIDNTKVLIQNDVNVVSKSHITVRKVLRNQTAYLTTDKFAVVAKFPCTQALFSYTFSTVENDNYDVIRIEYTYNQLGGSATISFDADAVDGYGNALYYTKYNEGTNENLLVHFVEINENVDCPQPESATTISAWGDEVLMNEPTVADYQTAILKYEEYEDKQYRFIWDSGYTQPAFAKTMYTVACEKNAQVVPSYPVTYKKGNEQDVLNYNTAIGIDSYRFVHVVPAHKSTYNGTFLTTVPGSLSYIVARINAYKNVTPEFQPLFGATRGTCSAPNIVWNVNKTTQQLFADQQINTIVSNLNGVYLNFNMTGQKSTSYLNEEQNVYMSDVIAGICETFNPTIIAEMNTSELWQSVETILTSMLTQRVMSGKNPTVNNLRVRCSEIMNANPDYVESRMLKYYVDVMYNLSVAYVNAYVSVVRLNSF